MRTLKTMASCGWSPSPRRSGGVTFADAFVVAVDGERGEGGSGFIFLADQAEKGSRCRRVGVAWRWQGGPHLEEIPAAHLGRNRARLGFVKRSRLVRGAFHTLTFLNSAVLIPRYSNPRIVSPSDRGNGRPSGE